MTRLRQALCASLLMIAPVPAAAATYTIGDPRAHDPGFFMRFSLGAGTATPAIEPGAGFGRLEFSGPAIDLDLALGLTVRENLALHATVFGWNLVDPSISPPPAAAGSREGSVILETYGAGATWFLMPANVYLTGSVGAGRVKFEFADLGVNDRTDLGVAFTFGGGKEWWLTEAIGLGLSGHFTYFSAQDSTVPAKWAGPGFGLRASMTVN